ncbi:GerAB/ArcD/ProY family transporter [Paenibacillus aestuarii]|uniref:Endospore germination permease n=1 Tax=Paenibacillus aestuarii TaxID=516965 RepID=A0ABW0K6X0_9BACL|nr:endospore germination permease [Paenibacillus aestuarii]
MQTEKISGTQLGLLLFTFVISTIVLTIPRLMFEIANQDAWIAVVPSTTTGLLSITVMVELSNRYPGMSIIQYSSSIIGKWLGKCLGVYYLYFWFISISVMTKQHTVFISSLLLPKSPSYVGSFTILLLSSVAVYAGIEVIARSNEFLTPLILVCLFSLLIISIKEADPAQVKPILGNGLWPVIQAAISPAGAFMNQFFILGWLLPYLDQPKKACKVSLIALIGICHSVLSVILLTIMIMGPLTSKLNYSFLSVIQYTAIKGSFERLEAVAVSLWVMGTFVKISLSLFILCLSLDHLFSIRNYRQFIVPLALLSFIGSIWIFKDYTDLNEYIAWTYPIGGFITQSIIPFALLLIDMMKKRMRK